MKDSLKKLMDDYNFELKETEIGSHLMRFGNPLPHTCNKSEEYIEGYIMGFLDASKR